MKYLKITSVENLSEYDQLVVTNHLNTKYPELKFLIVKGKLKVGPTETFMALNEAEQGYISAEIEGIKLGIKLTTE